jgi:uncharacterized FlaG/YvyC family protein
MSMDQLDDVASYSVPAPKKFDPPVDKYDERRTSPADKFVDNAFSETATAEKLARADDLRPLVDRIVALEAVVDYIATNAAFRHDDGLRALVATVIGARSERPG